MKVLFYDCFSGISGDMNLGAMLDLGIEEDFLKEELLKLKLPGWELDIQKDQRHGIYGTRLTVIIKNEDRAHRHLSDIKEILDSSDLDERVKETSLKIFTTIARAEAKVHNTTIDRIHFHEVGAIDSIVDVVGAAICYEKLGVDRLIVGRLELGSGFVDCAHGTLPVPAPATVEILHDIPVSTGGVDFEATTPTGAAIIKSLANEYGGLEGFRILKSAYGIGQKVNPSRPNILRVYLGEMEETSDKGNDSVMMECNIDDMNPEWYNEVIDKLINAGASDAFLTPLIMKQGRPGVKISVLARPEKIDILKDIIFSDTTTLGLRYYEVGKYTLEREYRKVSTPFGELTVKLAYHKNKLVSVKPEHSDCLEISRKEGISLKEITKIVMTSFGEWK